MTVAGGAVAGRRQDVRAVAAHRDRGRRQRIVGADADLARQVFGIRRRLQHELARAPIVNPDRRAIGAEQAVGAVAEDVEPRRQIERRRQGAARTRRAARAGRAAAPRSAAAGTARARSGTRRRFRAASMLDSVRRRCRRTRSPAGRRARRRAPSGRSSAARCPQARGQVRHLTAGVGDEHRSRRGGTRPTPGPLPASPGIHGSVRSSSRPKPEVACRTPLRGLSSNSSEHGRRSHRAACWWSCGRRSVKLAVRARREMSGGAAVAVSSPGVRDRADRCGRPRQPARSRFSGH